MPYEPINMSIPEPKNIEIEKFAGADFSSYPTEIASNKSPDMLNIILDAKRTIDKRPGYIRIFDNPVSNTPVRGLFYFNSKFIFATNGKLYTLVEGELPVELYSGLNDDDITTFIMNSKFYILDGLNYLVYDGITVSDVEDDAYIPTLSISRTPDGNGTKNEDINLLSPKFKDSFSATGTDTVFKISFENLDSVDEVKVNEVVKNSGTDYSVDLVNGKVTFTAAPAEGTNNVIIQASKAHNKATQIKKCKHVILFGGDNDTRVFLSGNPDYPNWDFKSGLYDLSYFPENGFTKIGSDSEAIQGYKLQYDTCVIEKENSKWVRYYNYNDGAPTWPVKPINDTEGLIAPKTLKLINNSPTGLNKKGVYQLVGGTVRDERNVIYVSKEIDHSNGFSDKGLLDEENLSQAIAFDFDKKYGICINNNLYLWDYVEKEWIPWDNIPASCFLEHNGYLYFGSNSEGLIYKFKKTTDVKPYNDDNQPINAYWKSKFMAMGVEQFLKFVESVHVNLKPSDRASVDIYYKSNKKDSGLIKTGRVDLLNYADIDYNNWSYITSSLPQAILAKVKAKKIIYFQIILKNDRLDEAMGITNINIKYDVLSEVK